MDSSEDFIHNFNHYDDIDDLDEPDQYIESLFDNNIIAAIDHHNIDEESENHETFGIETTTTTTTNTSNTAAAAKTTIEKTTDKINNIEHRITNLPLSRIKTIMKYDPDVSLVANEALYLVTKATELFIESLSKEAFHYTSQSRKKTLQRHDVDLAIGATDALMFLDGALNV